MFWYCGHGMICSRLPSNGGGMQLTAGHWGMQMIQVHPRAYDLAKFGERPAAFRLTGPVRRQIARHDVWSTRNQRAEVPASAEVSRLIHDSRLIEVGVAPRAYSVGGPAE